MNSGRSSTTAIILGLLFPGAGHWYAGRGGAGIAWFVIITIVSFVGWTLIGPSFYITYGSMIAIAGIPIPFPLCVPEIANFLETLFVYKYLARPMADAPIPPAAAYGYLLTATGGILNLIAAADAHFYCKYGTRAAGRKSPALAALFAWLIPGGGHFYLRRRAKAALGCGALVLTFLVGVLLTRGTSPQRDRDLYFWSGEILLGIPAAAATVINFGRRVKTDMPLGELGLLFTTVAGLLNVLFILDAYATAERDIDAPAAVEGENATVPAANP